jgi:hypothetical protein
MDPQDLPQVCFYCDNLHGCLYLGDSKGMFVPERIIDEEHPRECPEWVPVGPQKRTIRETLYGIQGEGCIRVLYTVSKIIMNDLDRQVEEGEIDVSETPNFDGMRVDGMTVEEREEQLRYLHDESGNVIVDEDGRKRPTPSYDLRKYACDPHGHVGLDHSVGLGWNNDQVIKFILDSEVEQGFLSGSKKNKSSKPKHTTTAAIAAPKETNKMAGEGRRVLINRGKKGGAAPAKTESKVASPPRRNKAKTHDEEPENDAQEAQPAAAPPAQGGDLQDLLESIKAASLEPLQKLTDKMNELSTAVDSMHQRLEGIEEALGTIDGHVVDAATVLHDVMVDAGVLEGAEPKLDTEGGILSYIPSDPS